MMQNTKKWIIRGLLSAAAVTALVLLVLNIGSFPELMHTTFFQVVATIVALNTMVYAVLGSRKVAALPAKETHTARSVTE
ncbi:MAG: hypothetical protein KDC39_15145 [Actinobacteria bacterium]|nr:hypothetical protein [Actinomycetota bacterium]